MRSKSVEELENDYWKEPKKFPTVLVKRCHGYRKIPLDQMTTEQVRTLISQEIGVECLIGLAIEKLERNVLEEGDLYPGDLLKAVCKLPTRFWDEYSSELLALKKIITSNSELIQSELGEKELNRINESVQ